MTSSDARPPSLAEIAAAIEAWAPRGSSQSYDNVGLQIGRPDRAVERGLVALDLTPAVVDEAIELRADVVVTHHPLIFRPLKNLTPATLPAALALRVAAAEIALYSAHTNLDATSGGVSFALAERLGLERVRFLSPLADSLYKLVTFVPHEHLSPVRDALAAAGAGDIGAYDSCAFVTEGTGYFRAGASASPFIGTAGGSVENVQEQRLEVEVSRWNLQEVLKALRSAHPYEEVAYDVYPVVQASTTFGLGAVGELAVAETLEALLERISDRLHVTALRYAGDPSRMVGRVAVCGGAGGDLIPVARREGVDAFVTADLSYHRYFDVLDERGGIGMALIDVGHYESEAPAEDLLVEWLAQRFPSVSWQKTSTRTSPVDTFVRPGVRGA